MTTPADPQDDLLAERYGRPDPRTRARIIAAVAVVAVVGLGWLVWAAWLHSNPDVSSELVGYEVTSDHNVHVVISVKRTSGAEVDCVVKALSDEHSVVGEQGVTVPSGEAGTVRYEGDITTDRRATTVQVSGCH